MPFINIIEVGAVMQDCCDPFFHSIDFLLISRTNFDIVSYGSSIVVDYRIKFFVSFPLLPNGVLVFFLSY